MQRWVTYYQTDEVLERSHAERRAGLRLASKEILLLNFGKRDTQLLWKLREVLREGTAVSKGVYRLSITGKKPRSKA